MTDQSTPTTIDLGIADASAVRTTVVQVFDSEGQQVLFSLPSRVSDEDVRMISKIYAMAYNRGLEDGVLKKTYELRTLLGIPGYIGA